MPKASRLSDIFQTAVIGTLYGLLFAGLLLAPLLPHLTAQSRGTPARTTSTAQLQDGARIQNIWIKIGEELPWKKWLKSIAGVVIGGYGANAIYDELNKTWELPTGRRFQRKNPSHCAHWVVENGRRENSLVQQERRVGLAGAMRI